MCIRLRLVVLHSLLVVPVLEVLKGALLIQSVSQDMLMLLCRNAAYSLLGAASYVTPSLTLPCSQSSTKGPPYTSTSTLQIFMHRFLILILPFISLTALIFFHVSFLFPYWSYTWWILSVARQGALSSNSFHILNVSYVPNLTVQHCSLCHHDCSEVDSKKKGGEKKDWMITWCKI
jgi:hypothetical protein